MSKFTNRPMSEYEAALHQIAGVLALAMVKAGFDNQLLAQEISSLIRDAREESKGNQAASLEWFIKLYLESPSGEDQTGQDEAGYGTKKL